MRFKVDVDATPEELRAFFGLPDVQPLQNDLLELMRQRMHEGVEGYDPLTLMRPLIGQGVPGMETLQQAFWEAFRGQAGSSTGTDKGGGSKKKQDDS